MKEHAWVCEVLKDLHDYAKVNDLPEDISGSIFVAMHASLPLRERPGANDTRFLANSIFRPRPTP
jgi:hypothetical protein